MFPAALMASSTHSSGRTAPPPRLAGASEAFWKSVIACSSVSGPIDAYHARNREGGGRSSHWAGLRYSRLYSLVRPPDTARSLA
ncbi:hypothetical protein GCM10022214_67900 [Actinomadura miaoliensis]|uniref:Secreted protein n=1 Tax=Actinomadura miaoliensis TaxID=430685 RepID=A0ABP7WRX4_9ACTN